MFILPLPDGVLSFIRKMTIPPPTRLGLAQSAFSERFDQTLGAVLQNVETQPGYTFPKYDYEYNPKIYVYLYIHRSAKWRNKYHRDKGHWEI